MSEPILVLDVGGTKLAAGILLDDNTVVSRAETPTLAEEGGEAVLARLVALGRRVLMQAAHEWPALPTPAAVGLASAGYIDQAHGVVRFATDNLPGWTGLPLSARLQAAFALPAAVANDAACFALAEAAVGAGRGYRHVLVVAVGTGVGGGVVINGVLYSGWEGRAGAIGHLCVEPVNGRPCTCGLGGCLEAYTATRVMVAESGYPSIQALAESYTAGNEEPTVDEAAIWLGRGLATLAHVLGPEAIVIGGSVGLLGERYLQITHQSFQEHTMPLHQMTPLLPAALGADSGLLGAGILARSLLQKEDS